MGLFGKSKFNRAFEPYEMPEEQRSPRFWEGGNKFTGRDAIAGILAAIGDAFAQQNGGEGGAIQMLAGGRLDAIQQARKAQLQAQEIAAARQRAQAAGLNPALADLMAHGDAKFSDLQPKPTAEMQNYQAWAQMTPEQRAQFSQYRDVVDPTITNGYGSMYIPRTIQGTLGAGIPQGYDPNEWEVVPGPSQGGAGPSQAPRPFRYR